MKLLTTAFLLSASTLAAQQFAPGRTAAIPPLLVRWPAQDLALGDLDGDGFDDLVAALDYGGVAHLRNDRHGGFVDVTSSVLQPAWAAAYGVSLGDADADGDLDLVAVHDHGGVVQVCLNQGDGTWLDVTSTFSPTRTSFPYGVTWIDIDGDRLLDVFVIDRPGGRLFQNRGGRLVDVTASHLPTAMGTLHPPAEQATAMDIDADGDQDLVLFGSPLAPFLVNDGSGWLSMPTTGTFPAGTPILIEAGDFDGDGLIDLVARNGAVYQLLLQTASGTFVDVSATHLIGFPPNVRALASDVDLDGDLDLCSPTMLLVNDGTGRFTNVTATRWTPLAPAGSFTGVRFAIRDVDADGDPDFVTVDRTSAQLVSFNRHRHLAAPREAVRGSSYALEFSAEPGYGAGVTVAVPWFALAPRNRFLPPFGHLGVDPATAVTGPPVSLQGPVGQFTLALTVPTDPGLRGVTLHVQAMLLDPSLRLRLTNTVRDTIR